MIARSLVILGLFLTATTIAASIHDAFGWRGTLCALSAALTALSVIGLRALEGRVVRH